MEYLRPYFDMVLSELSAQFAHDTAGAQVLTKAAALATGKITLLDKRMKIDYNLCDGCLVCVRECHTGAIKEMKEE